MQEFFDTENPAFVHWLKEQWNIEFDCVRRDMDIQGSPERTLSRGVIQTRGGDLFLLEKFSKNKFQIRRQVAWAVDYLNQKGLDQALSSFRTNGGEFLPFFKEGCFQLTPFMDSTGVNRPEYLSCAPMGKNFALFLIGLSRAASHIETRRVFKPFSIKNYIYKLFGEMKVHDPRVYDKFLPFLRVLEKEFMAIHDRLPLSFSHGDLHPLNVIWNKEKIRAVIDWEFAGMKPDIYDAANLVGCAGIEDPDGLGMAMVMTFLDEMRHHGTISDVGWQFFPEYVLALRFAWLSEWVRKKDRQMLEMEEVYMAILVDHMDELRHGWGLSQI